MQFFSVENFEKKKKKKKSFVAPSPMFEIYQAGHPFLMGENYSFHGGCTETMSWHGLAVGPHRLMVGIVGPLVQNVPAGPSGSSRMGC